MANTELINFHLSCKKELNELLKHFNLLFYGYGCKEALLRKLFPAGKVFNMHFLSHKSVVEELILEGFGGRSRTGDIRDIDEWLVAEKKHLTLILLNFKFESREFADLKNIKIIATMEGVDTSFEMEDLETFNFIFRDLTTFEDYREELMSIELNEGKVQNALMVFGNLPAKSKIAFKALLKMGNCTVAGLFDAVKKDLFLTKPGSLVDLLREFVDHKIIRIDENGIKLGLSKVDLAKLRGELVKG